VHRAVNTVLARESVVFGQLCCFQIQLQIGTPHLGPPPGCPGILSVLLMRDLWMWGMTPPPAMVAYKQESSSSCEGTLISARV